MLAMSSLFEMIAVISLTLQLTKEHRETLLCAVQAASTMERDDVEEIRLIMALHLINDPMNESPTQCLLVFPI